VSLISWGPTRRCMEVLRKGFFFFVAVRLFRVDLRSWDKGRQQAKQKCKLAEVAESVSKPIKRSWSLLDLRDFPSFLRHLRHHCPFNASINGSLFKQTTKELARVQPESTSLLGYFNYLSKPFWVLSERLRRPIQLRFHHSFPCIRFSG